MQKGISPVLDWSKWNFKWEHHVTKEQHRILDSLIAQGRDIIIADTNINQSIRNDLVEELKDAGYSVELKIFDIPLEEAIERDSKRGKASVGSFMIKKQWANLELQIKDGMV